MKKTLLIFLILVISIFACKKKVNTSPGSLKKGSPEYIMNMGLYYLNQGKIDLAEKELLKALRKSPNMLRAYNGLGIVYIYKRQFEKAITNFNRVLKMNPGYHDANNSLGLIYTELDKYDLAKENLLIAANSSTYSNPENAYHNLSRLEFDKGKYKSALRYVNKGLEIDKNFAPLLNMKGLIHETQNDFNEAIKLYNKARSLLASEDVTNLINLGRVYSKMGNKNKALDILEKALAAARVNNDRVIIRRMIKELEK